MIQSKGIEHKLERTANGLAEMKENDHLDIMR